MCGSAGEKISGAVRLKRYFPVRRTTGETSCVWPVMHIEARDLAAVNQVGMQRIGRDVSVFFDADRMPVAKSDFATVAAAGGAGRAAFLLAAVDPVGKLVVGDDVIELRGRLVVPGAPGFAAVDGDGRALIGGEDNDFGILGIDPDGVVVVAAGSAFDGGEGCAGVGGAVGGSVGDIDDVLIFRGSTRTQAKSEPRPQMRSS